MKIRYDSETDILLLIFREDPAVDAIEEPGGRYCKLWGRGEPVCIEFLNASIRKLSVRVKSA